MDKLFEGLLPDQDKYLMDLHTAASIGCEERVHDIIEKYTFSLYNLILFCFNYLYSIFIS